MFGTAKKRRYIQIDTIYHALLTNFVAAIQQRFLQIILQSLHRKCLKIIITC